MPLTPYAPGFTDQSQSSNTRREFRNLAVSVNRLTSPEQAVGSKFVTLADAATITINAKQGNSFVVTLGGNRTLANPTDLTDGQIIALWVYQDGTGGRTLAYGSKFKWPGGTAPTVASGANDLSVLTFQYRAAADILAGAYLLDVG